MKISFENKVALVTGAASGLGLATAKAFAEAGASVVLADWNEKEVQAAAKDLASKGIRRWLYAVMCRMTLRWKRWSSRPLPRLVVWMRPITMPAFKTFLPKQLTLPVKTTTA